MIQSYRILFSFLLCCFFTISLSAQVDYKQPDKVYKHVGRMPCYINCDGAGEDRTACCNESVLNFMKRYLRYPEEAKKAGLEGIVVIKFVVDADGTVINPEILSDIGKGCGEEALRVVNMMSKWAQPGMQNNRYVAVEYNLPVRYSLEEEYQPSGEPMTAEEIAKDIEQAAVIMSTFFQIFKEIVKE